MQDELEQYVQEYYINQHDTERRQQSVSGHTNMVQQMKTVRYNSVVGGRKQPLSKRTCLSQNAVVKPDDSSRQSACTHLNIRELHNESESVVSVSLIKEREAQHQSIIVGDSEPVIESSSMETIANVPRRKTINLFLFRWKKRISEYMLLAMSFGIVFLFPLLYSFIRSVFITEDEYRMTFIPPLPARVKTSLVVLVASAAYFILFLIYIIKKYLHKRQNLQVNNMYIAAAAYISFQLIVMFMWLDGVRLSQQMMERFEDDSNYQSRAPVVLLLRWRLLWISNTAVMVMNTIGLVVHLIVSRCCGTSQLN